jgi:hypothetical protein
VGCSIEGVYAVEEGSPRGKVGWVNGGGEEGEGALGALHIVEYLCKESILLFELVRRRELSEVRKARARGMRTHLVVFDSGENLLSESAVGLSLVIELCGPLSLVVAEESEDAP